MSPRKPAYVGMETINILAIESAPATLTKHIVRTGCDRYANRIMEIWGLSFGIVTHDFVANTLVSHWWGLSTNPERVSAPLISDRSTILGGSKLLRFNATTNDPRWKDYIGVQEGIQMFPTPIEVADDELYLWYETLNGTVIEGLYLKLYIKYKTVSKEHYLDVLETFR